MSEITRGVIGMPYEMAMSSEMSRRQFHARAQELLAENAGLKTGYEAYERVNAELKAEVKKIDGDRKACWAEFKVQGRYIDQLKAENDALRKDADRLDWLTAQGEIEQPGQGDVRGYIDAAMGRGEQS